MRIYKSDGSFIDRPNDTEFGWYFKDIVVDETAPRFRERNKETRMFSRLCKSLDQSVSSSSLESMDVEEATEETVIEEIEPNVRIAIVKDVINCEAVNDNLSTVLRAEEFKDIDTEKERLANNISPCSVEAKMLLSVVYFSKYKNLQNSNISGDLLRTVNFRTSNSKHLLSDKQASISSDMYEDIINYQSTKEDNMLSLMLELILNDADCSIEDVIKSSDISAEENDATKNKTQLPVIPKFVFETSDLGNSIPSSSSSSKRGTPVERYLQIPNRTSVLNSLGLSDEDKSIQSISEETGEMHHQLCDIKKSFQEMEDRVNNLLSQTAILENNLKEVLHLDNIIHLLNGDVQKVKLKKLPFRIFHEGEEEPNLII